VDVIDLREYDDPDVLKARLASYDLIWAMGGNTYMLRYEMHRSGFEKIVVDLALYTAEIVLAHSLPEYQSLA